MCSRRSCSSRATSWVCRFGPATRQRHDVARGETVMEVPKSEISKKADAARAKATGLKAAREKAANAIAGDLDAARAEVSRHDALPELSAPQHLALENARKRVKHLTSQLAEAGAAIAAAQEAIEAAEKVRDRAWLADLDADARERDAALIQDFITTRLGGRRNAPRYSPTSLRRMRS